MNAFSFKNWLWDYGEDFWEGIRSLANLPLDNVHLTTNHNSDSGDGDDDDFDESDARDNCENQVDRNWDGGDFRDNIYDNYEDDPDFDATTVDDWEGQNPEPDRDDFESDEEHEAAQSKWQEERDEAESDFDIAVRDWEHEMNKTRNNADEAESEARWEEVSQCVDEKQQEWRRGRDEREAERSPQSDGEDAPDNSGYTANFKYGNDIFQVGMDREKDAKYQGTPIPGFFNITFQGPNGYSTTKTAGASAVAIYNHLLASVKKMMDSEEQAGRKVNGFTFYPAEPAMGLIYQKFYTDYLQPAGYVRVKPKEYLKTDFIKKLMAGKSSQQKKATAGDIVKTRKDVDAGLKAVRDHKIAMRQEKFKIDKLIGKVVFVKQWATPLAGYVYASEVNSQGKPRARVVIMDTLGVRIDSFFVENIEDKEPEPDVIAKLLQAITTSRFMTSVDGAPFRQLVAQYLQQPNMPKPVPGEQPNMPKPVPEQ